MKTITILIALCFLNLSGCGTIQKLYTASTYETSSQTADSIIVSAEKLTEAAAYTFDQFLLQERKYSVLAKTHVPKAHEFAEYLRKPVDYKGTKIPQGVALLKQARAATIAFKSNRTAEGEANLRTAIAGIKAALDQTNKNLADIESLKGP